VKVQAPCGFVIGCHAGDKVMVQATLASMRRGRLNIMSGSIRTRLSGEIYSTGPHRRGFLDFLERNFHSGVRHRDAGMAAAFFVLIRPKLHRFGPDFEWRGTLISALAHLLAGAMQSHSINGIELSRRRGSHRGCLPGVKL
jgi:hypothetical protein